MLSVLIKQYDDAISIFMAVTIVATVSGLAARVRVNPLLLLCVLCGLAEASGAAEATDGSECTAHCCCELHGWSPTVCYLYRNTSTVQRRSVYTSYRMFSNR